MLVRWPDGSVHDGTPSQILDEVKSQQWRNYSRFGFRRALAHRARVWSGARVRTWGTSEQFLRDLEHAKMLEVIDG